LTSPSRPVDPAGGPGSLRVAVLSDTHRRPAGGPEDPPPLPGAVLAELAVAEVILHAGDIVSGVLLDQLATIAPTYAVLGNNDHELVGRLPETRELTLAGVRVAMIHDSGARAGRARRLQRRFPDADVVVFGHSHDPVDEPGLGGQWLFNPGSPTQRRRQPHPTMGVLHLAGGRVVGHRLVTLTGASA
jgi:putative phosphoesterase